MLDRLVSVFTSLKLTVALLALGLVLVFWGTIAQVHLGLYKAQNEFFRSFLIYWQPAGSALRIPIFPGGYLVGGLLLINLFAAHFRYYKPGRRKIGIVMIHLGVVLLLAGQFLTDVLSVESTMHIRQGGTKNYSEADRTYELAITDTSDAQTDKVVVLPAARLLAGGDMALPDLPFALRTKTYFVNSVLSEKAEAGYSQVNATAGMAADAWWRELPHETEMNKRDMPSGVIEVVTPQGSLGSYLVSTYLARPQTFTHNGRRYQLELRPVRFYKPFTLQLLEFRHDKYPGTEIPKNFSSRVRLHRPDTGEDREFLIYMNNPLRYNGETYYQSSFDPDNQGTIFQVVRNPGWLTPYFACVLVGVGLVVQFVSHLMGFAARRKNS